MRKSEQTRPSSSIELLSKGTDMHLLPGQILFGCLHFIVGLTRCDCMIVQVDLVCHGKTEVFPDKDGSDPYAVSTGSFLSRTVTPAQL